MWKMNVLFVVFFCQIVLSLSTACAEEGKTTKGSRLALTTLRKKSSNNNNNNHTESDFELQEPPGSSSSSSSSVSGSRVLVNSSLGIVERSSRSRVSPSSSIRETIVNITAEPEDETRAELVDDEDPPNSRTSKYYRTGSSSSKGKGYGSSGSKNEYQAGGGSGGVYGYTHPATTSSYTGIYSKPTPSYYRPRPTTTTTTEYYPSVVISTSTFRPIIPVVTSTTTTTTTTAPPPSTSTFAPIVTSLPVTIPPTTFRPTTAPPTPAPTAPSTTVPIIGGGDGDDEDSEEEEEEDVPAQTTIAGFNTEGNQNNKKGQGVGRSLFASLRRRPSLTVPTKSPTTTVATIGRQSVAAKLLSQTRPGSRALKFQEEDPNVVTDFVFSDIKCYRTKQKEYFGASIHMKTGYHVPYIRDRPQDPLTASDCRMDRMETPDLRYRMVATDLRACGVEQCGDSLCLTMVFPRVPTLALADDEVTTIKCLPQKSSISETQTISFSGDTLENRRSSSTVEGGGQDFAAEVGVFRQNPGTANGLFAKRVNSGGVVQLGEPLQLRSVVRGGDGWAFSKLTDVKVWRMRDGYTHNVDKMNPNDASEVITLVDSNGCRNPEYEVIAESHPLRDPRNNLVHHFTFRAFLFRGQRANEPLIVTSKVQACQEAGECRTTECSSAVARSSDPNVKRYRRSPVEHHNASSIIHDYDTQLALRVVGLRDHSTSLTADDFAEPPGISSSGRLPGEGSFTCTEKMAFAAVGGSCIMLFLCGLAFSLICYSLSNRRAAAALKNSQQQQQQQQQAGEIVPYDEAPRPDGGSRRTTDVLRKQGKPLPPPPKDYERVSDYNGNSVTHKPELGKRYSSGNNGPCDYECIDESTLRSPDKSSSSNKSSTTSPGDDVYIVYCCKKDSSSSSSSKKQKRIAASAPSSLREVRHSRGKVSKIHQEQRDSNDDSSTEESEFYSNNSEKIRPRTVRGVKRTHNNNNNHKHRAGTTGIRRRLSSIYREVYGNRYRSGSFPARISVKNLHGSSDGGGRQRGKIYLRDGNEIYSDGLSQSSDLDSAYCGSVVGSKQTTTTEEAVVSPSSRNAQVTRRADNHPIPHHKYHPGVSQEIKSSHQQQQYSHEEPSIKFAPKAQQQQHFVTRNEASTQIIILPETDV